jgi:RNA polymerase sigma-70 factor, ECF subfamily
VEINAVDMKGSVLPATSHPCMNTEEMLILKAQNDPAAFEPLYNNYFKRIFLYIYKRTDNEALTADMTSHTFLKAMENLKYYSYKGLPFSSWLFRIATNIVIQHFRDNPAQRIISIDNENLDELAFNCETENTEEKFENLSNALSYLDEQEILLVEWKYFEKRSHREIAEILNISENNAKVKLYRVIQKLKDKISITKRKRK